MRAKSSLSDCSFAEVIMRAQMRTKRNSPLGTILSALLLSVLVAHLFFGTANANPGILQGKYQGTMEAPYPPVFTVTEPKNNSVLNKDDISFSLRVSIQRPEEKLPSGDYIYYPSLDGIYYTSDWLPEEAVISRFRLHQNDTYNSQPLYNNYEYNLSLTDIPDGEHQISFLAKVGGLRITSGDEYWMLSTNASLTVDFTVDTTPPSVVISSIENKTYSNSNISLIFNTDEFTPEMMYILDGKESLRIQGNTSLNGLSDGLHNVTVHVWDEASNFGSSETVYFNVKVPFPIATVVVSVSGVSAAIACIGVIRYLNKCKKKINLSSTE